MRAFSTVKKNFHYGAPGLGDRIHSVLLAYNYGVLENSPVTLHLTKYQWNRHKPQSWPEIIDLFPKGTVEIMTHLDFEPTSNADFVKYVRDKGYDAHAQIYGDYPQRFEPVEGIDLTNCLKHFPQLKADMQDIKLPKKFITVQFDSTSKKRMIKPNQRQDILNNYKDYEIVVVGGESKNVLLRDSLKHIAFAMNNATYHVGVDSGFMHMAQVYFSPENIHIYTTSPKDRWSHHMHRAKDNGIKINESRN